MPLANDLASIKQSVSDLGSDVQSVVAKLNDLANKQASGQQVTDQDVADIQAEAQGLQQSHAALQQALASVPATGGGAAPAAQQAPQVGATRPGQPGQAPRP